MFISDKISSTLKAYTKTSIKSSFVEAKMEPTTGNPEYTQKKLDAVILISAIFNLNQCPQFFWKAIYLKKQDKSRQILCLKKRYLADFFL